MQTRIFAAGATSVASTLLVACSSGRASTRQTSSTGSTAPPPFTTNYGQDAAIIASHITGCTSVAAGSVGHGGTSGMSSTASCTLHGHTVIIDSWMSADAMPDASTRSGAGHWQLDELLALRLSPLTSRPGGRCLRFRSAHARHRPPSPRTSHSQPSYRWDVAIEDVVAGDLRTGDLVRIDDPQAHRIQHLERSDGRIELTLRPVGLDISETVRLTLPEDRLVTRLGTAIE